MAGKVQLEDGDLGEYAGFEAPTSMDSGSVIWKLPNADGTAGEALITDSFQILSWGTPSATVYDAPLATIGTTNVVHNANLPAKEQNWIAHFTSNATGKTTILKNSTWIEDIGLNDIDVDFSFLVAGDTVNLKLEKI